ncbi:hypothetical protein SMC_00168 [Enterococcus faecium EnGen0179]|nr:hypothetical protein [Enterococcus faecium]EOG21447.1 hypothetical protein SMC_00168 [Enterococcus faecium EnGen0179]
MKQLTVDEAAKEILAYQQITALCQMMLVKRNLRIIGDQVDQFLLIFFS